jgi:hypothetical protein
MVVVGGIEEAHRGVAAAWAEAAAEDVAWAVAAAVDVAWEEVAADLAAVADA